MSKYIWRELVTARTSGFCLICEDVISKGNEMVVLGTGPRGGRDWDRAHQDCAFNSDDVLDKPDLNKPTLYYEPTPTTTFFDISGIIHEVQIVEVNDYVRGQRYEVQVNGQAVRRFSDRRRAEGAAEMLQHMETISA